MSDKKYLEPQNGELKANEIVKFFDNVCNEKGMKLSKSAKRTRILEFMKKLSLDEKNNTCTLEDGRVVPIIVERKYEGRPVYCYCNTANAPKEEILGAFAKKFNITYISQKPEPKKEGELIAQEVLHLLDDIKVNNKKVTGTQKRARTIWLFQHIYKDSLKNICILSDGNHIPIIVKRTGENNRIGYFLNSSEHRTEVLRAFARAVNCTYLEDKENDITPEKKKKGELTSRDCVKVFHEVDDCPLSEISKGSKEKLLEWFNYIYYKRPDLNKVRLPDGSQVDVFVRRISRSQRCVCLNTSDATIKPFVLKRVAEISKSKICLSNLDLSNDDKKQLYKSLYILALASDKSTKACDKEYYHAYAQKAFLASKIKTTCLTVDDYLLSKVNKKR